MVKSIAKNKKISTYVIALLLGMVFVLQSVVCLAQESPPPAVGGKTAPKMTFNASPLEFVLSEYANMTHRTLLVDPKTPKVTITLRSQTELTEEEYLEAIERVLRMNGVAIVPVGEKFLNVVPITDVRKDGAMVIRDDEFDAPLKETGKLVSQFITLKHIDVKEAEAAIKPFMYKYGQINSFPRSGSILITDAEANVNRMAQIIGYIDQPIESREEPHVIQIRFAKATDIKKKLEEIVKSSKDEEKKSTVAKAKTSGAPGVKATPSLASVIRARRSPTAKPAPSVQDNAIADMIELAGRGIIRGKVLIMADERTNLLIIITRPENMKFFNKIITVLDVETKPDVVVKVFRLEFAKAETVAKNLNELIGKKSAKDPVKPGKKAAGADKGASLEDFIALRKTAEGLAGKSNVGELSAEHIKILHNERTNALIIMASKGDMATLTELVKGMDMMLSQVLIEVVILNVELDDKVQTGVDWVQRSMIAYEGNSDGTKSDPLFSFAGGGGGGEGTPLNASSLINTTELAAGLPTGHGISYYFTHFGLNIDAILTMAAQDSRTQVISSPIIVTHDNTEAKIESSEERYFYKGKRWVNTGGNGGTYQDDVEMKPITLLLTVTPHINTNKLVVMEIAQKMEELGAIQDIGGVKWPTRIMRDMSAEVAVQNKETIILGGLVKKEMIDGNYGIPYLRKLPLIGALFRYKSEQLKRSEIVVFITPYVLDTPEEIMAEANKRRDALALKGLWKNDWSGSKLAERSKAQVKADKKAEKQSVKDAKRKASDEDEAFSEEREALEKERKKLDADQKKLEDERKALEKKAAEINGNKSGFGKQGAVRAPEANKVEVVKPSQNGAKTANLPPELLEFIKIEEQRWGKKMKKVDKIIEESAEKDQ